MPNTREKLEVIAHLGDHITYKEDIGICYDSALAKVIEDAYMELKNGVTVQEWISVKDRLPEIGRRILTLQSRYGEPFIYIDQFCGDGEWLFSTYNVTHWMPLPSTEGLK